MTEKEITQVYEALYLIQDRIRDVVETHVRGHGLNLQQRRLLMELLNEQVRFR